jgi:hypothetical protein
LSAGGGGLRFNQRMAARATGCGTSSSSSITFSHFSSSRAQHSSGATGSMLTEKPIACGSAAEM